MLIEILTHFGALEPIQRLIVRFSAAFESAAERHPRLLSWIVSERCGRISRYWWVPWVLAAVLGRLSRQG